MLTKITWNKQHVADFLGQYLTEPKPDVVFEPSRKFSKNEFIKQLAIKNVALNLKSQLLFASEQFYLNGEKLAVPTQLIACMRDLADKRYLDTTGQQANINADVAEMLHEHYLAGFINLKA